MEVPLPRTEVGALIAAHDWARTPLGPIERWPAPLATTVSLMLHSRHPMFLWWGPSLIQLYNDAYLPSFGVGKHPAALGQPGAECWQEIWPIIHPQIERVMHHAIPSWHEDQLVPIYRNGRLEEVYWTYGYSPVFGDDGAVAGTLVVCTETTTRVLSERRSRLLHRVAEAIARADDADAVIAAADTELAAHPADIQFARWYRAGVLRRPGGFGLDDAAAAAIDRVVARYLTDVPVRVAIDPPELRGPGASGAEPTTHVLVVPIARGERGQRDHLVAGLSPRLPVDDRYRGFVFRVADAVAQGLHRLDAWQTRLAVEGERNNLLLQAPVATAVVTGPDHVFTLVNPLYAALAGRADLVGRRLRDAFPAVAATEIPAIFDRAFRTGEPYRGSEHRSPVARGPDTRDRYFDFNLQPMRDAHGQVTGLLIVTIEITEQVEARRQLEDNHREREALLAELEAANRAKDEFLAMLGHELRNPLSPIVTALELLHLRTPGPVAPELAMIERQVGHLTTLVDDLLDVSRIARGQLELHRRRFELATAVERAIEIASPLLERARHRLAVDVPPRDLVVDADPNRIAQVLANLLTNAAKYTPAGGHLAVRARRDGADVVIEVQDDGVGIAADMLPVIFGLFTQEKQDLARSEGGLGLGLAIVKNLVERHGGTVTAASPGRGHGTTMTVRLPAAADVADDAPAPAPAGRSGAGRLRILIVDDNHDAAEALADVLTAQGHLVTIAHDGPDALRAVRADDPPAIALLDIGLPVMDGYQLARHLRDDPRLAATRLIALTGYGRADDRKRSAEAGFDAHLVKPVSIAALTGAIRALSPP